MISYYELLTLVKDKKQPDKVKYNNAIYKFDGEDYHNEQKFELLKDRLFMYSDINLIYEKSIEIIEDKQKKIEKVIRTKSYHRNLVGELVEETYCTNENIVNKIDELTEKVNYLLEVDKHE